MFPFLLGLLQVTCTILQAEANVDARVLILMRMLEDGTLEERIEAAASIGSLGPVACRAKSTLLAAADDPDICLRRTAVYALGRLGPCARDAQSVQLLLKGLKCDDLRLRIYSAFAIAQLCPENLPGALPALIEALWTTDWNVQKRAAYLIGELGPSAKDAVPYLVAIVHYGAINGPATWLKQGPRLVPPKNKNEESNPSNPTDLDGTKSAFNSVRKSALIALGKIGSAAHGATPFVEACWSEDRDPEIVKTSWDTLKRLCGGAD
jgi:HEAT repeat protein